MAAIKKSFVKKARIEIIPLIDVIFFLLATFVLFTLSLNKLTSIPVDLPKASPSPPENMPEIVRIEVSEAGTLSWNGESVSMTELPNKLAAYAKAEKDPRILITGDSRATFGPAIEVLDQVRLAKIDKVSIDTKPR